MLHTGSSPEVAGSPSPGRTRVSSLEAAGVPSSGAKGKCTAGVQKEPWPGISASTSPTSAGVAPVSHGSHLLPVNWHH